MIKPGEKGWLQKYLEYRKKSFKDLTGRKTITHPEKSLYSLIQPTGLMYGESVHFTDFPEWVNYSEKDQLQVILADSLLSSSFLFYTNSTQGIDEFSDLASKSLEKISSFYNNVFPEISIPTKTLFGRKKTSLELVEQILLRRIDRSIQNSGNFWVRFFHNSLLFLDIYIFGQWMHANDDRMVIDFFKYQRDELRFSVVKVISSAAHANRNIEFEEKKLLEYFLHSAGLSSEKKKEALQIFENGIEIEEISLPTNNSWILKRFFLEVAILTVWSDAKVEDEELVYLKKLCGHLGFYQEDLEYSLLAIEGFVLEHWKELSNLQNKMNFEQVENEYLDRLTKITAQNKHRLLKDARNNKEFIHLMEKANMGQLSEIEKSQVKEILLEIMKAIPIFSIISLPQNYLTISLLMKIFPQNFFGESLK